MLFGNKETLERIQNKGQELDYEWGSTDTSVSTPAIRWLLFKILVRAEIPTYSGASESISLSLVLSILNRDNDTSVQVVVKIKGINEVQVPGTSWKLTNGCFLLPRSEQKKQKKSKLG